MLIVVNAIFSMFSFCKLLYLNMFRRGAREAVRVLLVFPQIAQICTDAVRGGLIPQIAPGAADATDAVRGVSCFPTDRADLHRCRSGRANPADRAQARQMPQMPFGCCLFSHRSRRFAQMPFGCFLFSTQIAPLGPRCKREFCYNVTCYMLQ